MSNYEQIVKKYDALIENINEVDVIPKEAQRLATEFFKASYEINKIRRNVKSELILLEGAVNTLFTQAIKNAEGKNITEKKINANANLEYLKAVKRCEEIRGEHDYFRHLYDIMVNGHIFYKNLIKE